MKYASLHIIFLCLISSFELVAQTHLNNFHHLSVEDGLPSDLVYDVLQDRKGFMWFATGSGLCRYNGYTFKNHTVRNGITKNDIRRIFLDSRDKIWALPMGTVAIGDEKGFTIQNKTKYLGDDRKLSILEDSLGQIWLSSRNLTYISPEAKPGQLQTGKLGIRGTPTLEFVDKNQNIWISGREGLTVLRNKKVVRKIEPSYPSMDPHFQFVSCYLSDHQILHNTPEGIVFMDTLGNTRLAYEYQGSDFDMGQTAFIHEDQKGNIWVAGRNSGVLRLERTNDQLVLRDHALKGISVTRIFEDLEGNLWFATYGNGIYLLTSNAASITLRSTDIVRQLFPEQPKFESQIVSMETDSENRLWMTDAKGQVKIITRKSPTEWASESLDLSAFWENNTRLIQILSLSNQQMLIATTTGLGIYQNGTYTKLHGIEEPTSLHKSKSGEIVIGANDRYDYILSEKEVVGLGDNTQLNKRLDSWFSEGKRQFGAATNMKHKDHQGDIWTAFSRGLHRDADSVSGKRHFKDEPVFSARVEAMADSRDGLLWIATNGSGLIVVKGNLFQEINSNTKGMNSNVCQDILVDDQAGNIWIATNRGIGKISRYDFEENYFPIQWFTVKEGLLSNNIKNLYKYQGDIYVATDKGITLFDENKIQEDNFLPRIYITEVRANDKTQDLVSKFNFPYKKNSIEIFFTGISYRNLGHLQFQYKLEEVDEEWKTTTKTSIRYSSLAAGSYTFLVKAASANGPVSPKPAKIEFEISPIFYKTGWFIGLVFLAGILLLYGLLKYMYTARQRLELERRVDEKTYQLNQKVDELRRTNKDLEQFAYVASHDLKTPLRTVIGHLQLLERKYRGKLDKDAEDYIVFAVEGSKKMYGMINDLLAYAKVGREHLDFEPVDLNRVLASVERSLDGVIKEKNAVIHYEDLPTFMGVNTLWEQLFQNLIHNGLKFNLSEQPEIRIDYKDSPDYWIISVADNGIGIEEEYQARIFELFQRLHTTEFPGTGIGLAVCKRIVELHNGSIWVESESGMGTVFFFTVEKNPK